MGASLKKYLPVLLEVASRSGDDLYLIGGTIRDHLLGQESSDFDFTAKNVQNLAHQFASETKSPCIPLDATPGRETLRVVVNKQFYFDFTSMQGNSIEEDLAQRDFSINAMAMRLEDFLEGKETLIDINRGQEDLDKKTIRVLPGSTFSNDPLRMLRAFRFASSLEFDIDAETIRQIETEKSNLQKTAQERVYYEWILFLSGTRVFKLLNLMDQTGLLQCALPETTELRQPLGTHANAWKTSLQTFNRLEDLFSNSQTIIPSTSHAEFLAGRKMALLKFAALLHGLNPAFSRELSNPIIKIDEQTKTVWLLRRLKASNADIQFIFRTILCQQEARELSLEFADTQIDESVLYRFAKKYDRELMAGIFLARAVQSATENNGETGSFLLATRQLLDFYFQRYLPAMNHKALMTGDDLIRQFKLTPSPLFRLILDEVEEGQVLGTIKSKDQATAIAQQIIETHKIDTKHDRKI